MTCGFSVPPLVVGLLGAKRRSDIFAQHSHQDEVHAVFYFIMHRRASLPSRVSAVVRVRLMLLDKLLTLPEVEMSAFNISHSPQVGVGVVVGFRCGFEGRRGRGGIISTYRAPGLH